MSWIVKNEPINEEYRWAANLVYFTAQATVKITDPEAYSGISVIGEEAFADQPEVYGNKIVLGNNVTFTSKNTTTTAEDAGAMGIAGWKSWEGAAYSKPYELRLINNLAARTVNVTFTRKEKGGFAVRGVHSDGRLVIGMTDSRFRTSFKVTATQNGTGAGAAQIYGIYAGGPITLNGRFEGAVTVSGTSAANDGVGVCGIFADNSGTGSLTADILAGKSR